MRHYALMLIIHPDLSETYLMGFDSQLLAFCNHPNLPSCFCRVSHGKTGDFLLHCKELFDGDPRRETSRLNHATQYIKEEDRQLFLDLHGVDVIRWHKDYQLICRQAMKHHNLLCRYFGNYALKMRLQNPCNIYYEQLLRSAFQFGFDGQQTNFNRADLFLSAEAEAKRRSDYIRNHPISMHDSDPRSPYFESESPIEILKDIDFMIAHRTKTTCSTAGAQPTSIPCPYRMVQYA
ncbi:MAG: hypothetical protein IJ468_01640 [Lachnospiraceae bacterium]|nr:hypothetical protein [Lachnospiraceae bacterium]